MKFVSSVITTRVLDYSQSNKPQSHHNKTILYIFKDLLDPKDSKKVLQEKIRRRHYKINY